RRLAGVRNRSPERDAGDGREVERRGGVEASERRVAWLGSEDEPEHRLLAHRASVVGEPDVRAESLLLLVDAQRLDPVDRLASLDHGRDRLAPQRERTEDRVAVARARSRSGGRDARPEGGCEVDGSLERDGERVQTIARPVAHDEPPAVTRAAGREGGGGRDEREAEAAEPEALVGLGGERRRQPLRCAEHGEGERRLVPDLVAAGGRRHGPAGVSDLPLALVDAE